MLGRIRHLLAHRFRNGRLGRWFLDDLPVSTRSPDPARPDPVATRRLARTLASFDVRGPEASMSLRHYDGGDFIDIGAHEGSYCYLLATKARPGTVFAAFEPAPFCHPLLLHNLATLADLHPHVRFIPIALPAGNGGSCEFTFPMGTNFHPRVLSRPAGAPPPDPELVAKSLAFEARAATVDETVAFLGIRPSFIKVDVEGAEVFVIEGMTTTLARLRPTLLVEIHPGLQPYPEAPDRIVEILKSHAYAKVEETRSAVVCQQVWKPAG